MFNRCDFLMDQGQGIIIVIPAHLPAAEIYTVSVSEKDIKFKADYETMAEIPYKGGEVFERIAKNIQVGLVEYRPGNQMPDYITNVAYVEVRKAN